MTNIGTTIYLIPYNIENHWLCHLLYPLAQWVATLPCYSSTTLLMGAVPPQHVLPPATSCPTKCRYHRLHYWDDP
jgi:hypothetical protein